MIADLLKTTVDRAGCCWVSDGFFSVPEFWRDQVCEMANSFLATRGVTEAQALFIAMKMMHEILLERGQEIVDQSVAELEAKLRTQFPREDCHVLALKMAKEFARQQDHEEHAIFGEHLPGVLSGGAYRKNGRIAKMTKAINAKVKP